MFSQYLFKVQQKNRLKQKGLLRRFSISCYGTQATLESMRQEKTNKYEELKNKKKSNEYEEWFLKYTPATDSKKTKKAKSVNKPTNVKPKKKTKKINPAKKKVKRKKTRRVMFSWK